MSASRYTVLATLLALGPSCAGDIGMVTPDAGGARGASVSLLVETGKPAGTPVFPFEIGNLVVQSAVFWLSDMQLIGDQGAGDPRTRTGGYELDLSKPFQVDLAHAPPALYSRLSFLFDFPSGNSTVAPPALFEGRRIAFQVAGALKTGNYFAIRDERELALDLRAGDGAELAPGKRLMATVTTNLEAWFTDLAMPDGPPGSFLLIDGGDPRIERFRRNLTESFRVALKP